MSKWLIIAGAILMLVGVAWPWLAKLGIGHLPGDLYIERKGYSFYFPVTTSLIISVVLSILYWILKK